MRLILFGYYGFENVGDEQCLDETVRLINECSLISSFKVASGPVPIPFPCFNRWNIFLWMIYLFRSDAVVFGGGSVFQSKTSFLSLFFYLFIVCLAALFNCRVVLLCQGWGPFKYPWHEMLAKTLLQNTRRSWRTVSVPFNGDDTFCDLTLLQCPLDNVTLSGNSIGISLRSKLDQDQVKVFCKRQESTSIVIENQYSHSAHDIYLNDVWNQHELPLKYVITDRFHTAIWASRHGIPWVSLSDDPKLIDLAKQSNQPHFFTLGTLLDALPSLSLTDTLDLKTWADSHYQQRSPVKEWFFEQLRS